MAEALSSGWWRCDCDVDCGCNKLAKKLQLPETEKCLVCDSINPFSTGLTATATVTEESVHDMESAQKKRQNREWQPE